MIYLSGDTHGKLDIWKVADFFEIETKHTPLNKKDYLIILGDAGICWDNGESDVWVKRILGGLPVTTLWIDGKKSGHLAGDFPWIGRTGLQASAGGQRRCRPKRIKKRLSVCSERR